MKLSRSVLSVSIVALLLLLALVSARLLTATVTSDPLETATAFIRERLSLTADACPGGMQQLAFFHDLFQAKEFTQDPAFDVNGKNGVTEMDGLVFAQAMYGIVLSCGQGPSGCVVDGIKTAGEDCDDGDSDDENGCSNTCAIHADYTCSGAEGQKSVCVLKPAPQCRDGVDNDKDGKIDFPDDTECTSADGTSEALLAPVSILYPADGSEYLNLRGDNSFTVHYLVSEAMDNDVRSINAEWIDGSGKKISLQGDPMSTSLYMKLDPTYVVTWAGQHTLTLTTRYEDGSSYSTISRFTVKQVPVVNPPYPSITIVVNGTSSLNFFPPVYRYSPTSNVTLSILYPEKWESVQSTQGDIDTCNDGIDNNANGQIDEGCVIDYTINGVAGKMQLTSNDFKARTLPGLWEPGSYTITAKIGKETVVTSFVILPTACHDGLDNDGDGVKDYPQDTGCSHAGDPSENGAILRSIVGPAGVVRGDTSAITLYGTLHGDNTSMIMRVLVDGIERTRFGGTAWNALPIPLGTAGQGTLTIAVDQDLPAQTPGVRISQGVHAVKVELGRYDGTTWVSHGSHETTVTAYTCGNGKVDPTEQCDGEATCGTLTCQTLAASQCLDGSDNDNDGAADSFHVQQLMPLATTDDELIAENSEDGLVYTDERLFLPLDDKKLVDRVRIRDRADPTVVKATVDLGYEFRKSVCDQDGRGSALKNSGVEHVQAGTTAEGPYVLLNLWCATSNNSGVNVAVKMDGMLTKVLGMSREILRYDLRLIDGGKQLVYPSDAGDALYLVDATTLTLTKTIPLKMLATHFSHIAGNEFYYVSNPYAGKGGPLSIVRVRLEDGSQEAVALPEEIARFGVQAAVGNGQDFYLSLSPNFYPSGHPITTDLPPDIVRIDLRTLTVAGTLKLSVPRRLDPVNHLQDLYIQFTPVSATDRYVVGNVWMKTVGQFAKASLGILAVPKQSIVGVVETSTSMREYASGSKVVGNGMVFVPRTDTSQLLLCSDKTGAGEAVWCGRRTTPIQWTLLRFESDTQCTSVDSNES